MPPSSKSQANSNQHTYREYAVTTKRVISIIEIVCGAIEITLQLPCIALQSEIHYIGTGLWAGLVFIISGAFGLIEDKQRTQRAAKCSVGISAFTVFVALCGLALIITDFVFEFQFMQCDIGRYEPYYICTNKMYKHEFWVEYEVLCYILGFMIAVAIIELFAALLHAVLGCLGVSKIRTDPIETKYKKEEPSVVFIPVPETQFRSDGTLPRDVQKKYKNNPTVLTPPPEYDDEIKKKPPSSTNSSYDSHNGQIHIVTPEDEQRGIVNPGMHHDYDPEEKRKKPKHSSSESSSDPKQRPPKSPRGDSKSLKSDRNKHDKPDSKSLKSDRSHKHRHPDPERHSQRMSTFDRRSVANSSGRPRHVKPDYTRPPAHHGLSREKRRDVYTLKPFEN